MPANFHTFLPHGTSRRFAIWAAVNLSLTAATYPFPLRADDVVAHTANSSTPTFCRDVAPILWRRCVGCHHPGAVAPFSLTTYADAARRSSQLAEAVTTRLMPPWKAKPDYGHLRDSRWMSDKELAVVVRWAESGAAEGDSTELPPLPPPNEGWSLGTPDLVLEMPADFELPPDGENVFRWFALPVDVPAGKVIRGFEFQAGATQAVHHAIMFVDTSGAAMRLDEADPGPGYAHFGGPGFLPTGFLGSWSPGVTSRFLPEDMGIALRPRSVIALQMHYTTTGKPERDRSRIGLYLAPAAGRRMVTTIPVLNLEIEIPPGVDHHLVSAEMTLPVAVSVTGLSPHMHYLGREMKLSAWLPSSDATQPEQEIPLAWIRDWDFNWQDQYQLAEPLRLPKGARLKVEAWYDNTEANPANPHRPPQTVRYGSQSTDEMCLAGIQVALDRASDFNLIAAELVRKYLVERQGKPFINPFE